MSDLDEALNITYLLHEAARVDGDVVECGCYKGMTGVLLQKTLQAAAPQKKLYLFDSFQGLPAQTKEDRLEKGEGAAFKDNKRIGEGWFAATIEEVKESFSRYDAPLPEIIPGWFSDTLPQFLPSTICFAHLDGDFYESILCSLEHVYPRLSYGGIVVLDDYCDPVQHERINAYPGVKRACDAFFENKPETIGLLASRNGFQGFFQKQKPL